MKQKESMRQTKRATSVNKCCQLHSKEFGQLWVVTNEKEAKGYFCLDDLCRILNLKEEVVERLTGHIFLVTVDGDKGQQSQKYYVDEEGLYLMMLFSKMEGAIRFQDWLNEVYLNNLHELQKARCGLSKDDLLVVEENHTRQALRYMATADNVVKSGHFMVGKDIPELTMSHLMGWWNNPNDHSTFMLQFNCKGHCYIYENIRMNVYLTKDEDGHAELCNMTIKFLDLDDDNLEIMSYDTWIPEYAVTDNAILDYILEEMTLDDDFLEPKNVDVLVILNSIVSFHRSRRLE
jgi:BRO family, N-terminal domain.